MKKMKYMMRDLLLISTLILTGCISNVSKRSELGHGDPPEQDPNVPVKSQEAIGDIPQPLKMKKTYVLLQVDGGGIMGITPALVLAKIEEALRENPNYKNKHLKDVLSVCSGTSTGALISGMVAANVPAKKISDYYETTGVDLFSGKGRNFLPLKSIYDRSIFQDTIFSVMDEAHPDDKEFRLSDLDKQPGGAPLLIVTAFDLRSNRTHFIRSRDNGKPLKENDMLLVDAISCSAFNAVLYFGKIEAPKNKWEYISADGKRETMIGGVYNDGGQGSQNSTLGLTMLEALKKGWGIANDDQVLIISLGCGNDYAKVDYDVAKRLKTGDQLRKFFFFGQARGEASLLQWRASRDLTAANENYKIFRFDFVPEKADAFSINPAKKKELEEKAREICERKDFLQLIRDLKNPDLTFVGPVAPPMKSAPSKPQQERKADVF